jgi:hypothetical protein
MTDPIKQRIQELVPEVMELAPDFAFGSPITLAVVLRAIDKLRYVNWDTFRNRWNLVKDNYDEQTQKTKEFIGSLLGA